jgi:hypothetical protein
LYGFVVVLAPLAIAIAMAAGLRYLFPALAGANWLFQMTEPKRGIWPPPWSDSYCGADRTRLPGGIPRQRRGLRVGARDGRWPWRSWCLLFLILYRHWRKLPFTCSACPEGACVGHERAGLLPWSIPPTWPR